MGGPAWISDFLAGLMILTAVYCVGRAVIARRARRPGEPDVDMVHALMGVAMAGMLVASLKTLPAGLWAAAFALAAAWFGWQIAQGLRSGPAFAGREDLAAEHRHQHLPHLAMCCAMVYMLLAARTAAGAAHRAGGSMSMSSMGAARFPRVALLLTLMLAAFVVLDTHRLYRFAGLVPAQVTAARVEEGLALARIRMSAAQSTATLTAHDSPPVSAGSGLSAAGGGDDAGRPVAPRLALCCQIAMGATMAYMLVLML
jgi:hypothetical protein